MSSSRALKLEKMSVDMSAEKKKSGRDQGTATLNEMVLAKLLFGSLARRVTQIMLHMIVTFRQCSRVSRLPNAEVEARRVNYV